MSAVRFCPWPLSSQRLSAAPAARLCQRYVKRLGVRSILTTIWTLAKDVGSLLGLAVWVLLAAYYVVPPFRKLVDTWIERRVGARFDRELEDHRHSLRLDAEAVRAEYQRRLHDFSLYSVKKHEVYAELYRLILVADGTVGHLSGGRIVPSYQDYSAEDIRVVMEGAGFTGPQKEAVLRDWDADRPSAMRVFNGAMRNVEMNRGLQAVAAAHNYFLINSLYLSDALSTSVAGITKVLNSIIAHAMYPTEGSGMEQVRLKQEASELIERLKRALREDLESGAAVPAPTPSGHLKA